MRGRAPLLLGGLLALLVVAAALRSEPEAPYGLESSGPQGLRALRLWLDELGYEVDAVYGPEFAPPDDGDMVFVYPSVTPYTEEEAAALRGWVSAGGTLTLIAPLHYDPLTSAFDFSAGPTEASDPIRQAEPLLPDLPAVLELDSGPRDGIWVAEQSVPVLNSGWAELVSVRQIGGGTVWFLSSDFAFTNEQLHDEHRAALLPALLRTVPPGGRIYFDAYHLQQPPPDAPVEMGYANVTDWLWRNPAGWAVLYACAAALGFLLLEGRRLGPPLPAPAELRRREAAEFAAAMAQLRRRAGQRDVVAAQVKRRLKRALAAPLHLNPQLPDAEFVARLGEGDRWSAEQRAGAARLLAALDGHPDETALVRLAAAADDLLAGRPLDPISPTLHTREERT